MRLTERDIKLIRDVALSQVISRDQFQALGYFGSKSRCTSRLRALTLAGYIRVLTTPFHNQYLYTAGCRAKDVVGERIAGLLSTRPPSPQFVQHSLAVTGLRAHFITRGAKRWRFEPQLHQKFVWRGTSYEIRPDGFVEIDGLPTFIEADLGHVSLPKLRGKLAGYEAFVDSGTFSVTYEAEHCQLLIATTSAVRRQRLLSAGQTCSLPVHCELFSDMGLRTPGGWS